MARHQSKYLFTTDKNYIKDAAQILSDGYDLEKLDRMEAKKCALCQELSKKRCSKCKEVWYCSRYVEYFDDTVSQNMHLEIIVPNFCRQCQVKDWEEHKKICNMITKAK